MVGVRGFSKRPTKGKPKTGNQNKGDIIMRQKVNLKRTLTTNLALFIIAGAVTFALVANTNCGVAFGQKGTSGPNSQLKELGETLRANGNHQIFLSLLEAAGIRIPGSPPFINGGLHTVLAPNDAAFAKFPKDSLDALKKDPPRLRSFLLSYFVPGKIMIADMLVPVKDNPRKTSLAVKTLKGEIVSILCDDHPGEHHPRINGVARVGKGDILFAGGV